MDSLGLAGQGKSLEQLHREWTAEEALPADDFGWCQYGGYLSTKAKPTGFFRVEQVDGRWWFVDPDGHRFFSTSCTGIGGGGGEARIQGREDYFTALPPRALNSARRSPARLLRLEPGTPLWRRCAGQMGRPGVDAARLLGPEHHR